MRINRDKNIMIARDTISICSTGNLSRTKNIKNLIDYSISNTKIIEEVKIKESLHQMPYFEVSDNIVNLGTIDCVIKLRNEGVKGNIIALNFASATKPGGGFLTGATAQEESLCRASGLYPCLSQDKTKDFYNHHKNNRNPLYSDLMIYSPEVPIFKNDNNQTQKDAYLASFITCAAVNKKVAIERGISNSDVLKWMRRRIDKILSLAVDMKADALVLGAFGCGVFGNDKDTVFRLFEDGINEFIPKGSIRIIFGVIDTPPL